jgi:pilus assembly protein CpaC
MRTLAPFGLSAAWLLIAPASLQAAQPTAAARSLSIEVDRAQLVQMGHAAKTVFVANPDIADIQLPTPASFLVYGKKPGITTIFAIAANGATASYTVEVTRPAADIAAALQTAVPGANVQVSGTPNGVTITGTVASPRQAQQLRAAAKDFLGDKENVDFQVTVAAAVEVTLHVRVAEVSRTVDKELGVNWSALFASQSLAVGLLTGRATETSFGNFISDTSSTNYGSIGFAAHSGNLNLSTLIDALDQEGLATTLAEPSLTAISGETANFLAGGEYPVPVPEGNQTIAITYQRYGISVDFTPTVLDANRISIKVRPEVSELTTVGEVTLDGITVPALTVRRAETTVELGSGESFAIAGLFQNSASNQISGLPFLGNLPYIGTLFRSSSFTRNESELVIIVTPYIVRPVADPVALHVPTEGIVYPSDFERMLMGRVTSSHPAPPGIAAAPPEPHLQGAAGFMLE